MIDEIDDIVPEDSSHIREAYKQYSDQLKRIRPLNEVERIHLQKLGYVSPLRTDSLRLVLFVFHTMKRQGTFGSIPDMDVIQVGNVAALAAIPKWNPDKGTFSTYLYPYIRGAMLNFMKDEVAWSQATSSTPITTENASGEMSDWSVQQEEFEVEVLSPERELDNEPYDLMIADQIKRSIARLPSKMYDDIVDRYFLDISVEQMAEARNITMAGVYQHIRAAIRRLSLSWKREV